MRTRSGQRGVCLSTHRGLPTFRRSHPHKARVPRDERVCVTARSRPNDGGAGSRLAANFQPRRNRRTCVSISGACSSSSAASALARGCECSGRQQPVDVTVRVAREGEGADAVRPCSGPVPASLPPLSWLPRGPPADDAGAHHGSLTPAPPWLSSCHVFERGGPRPPARRLMSLVCSAGLRSPERRSQLPFRRLRDQLVPGRLAEVRSVVRSAAPARRLGVPSALLDRSFTT